MEPGFAPLIDPLVVPPPLPPDVQLADLHWTPSRPTNLRSEGQRGESDLAVHSGEYPPQWPWLLVRLVSADADGCRNLRHNTQLHSRPKDTNILKIEPA